MKSIQRNSLIVLAYVAMISMASFWIICDGASNEPYYGYNFSDAFVQIGLSTAMIALLVQLFVVLILLLYRRAISLWMVLCLLWISSIAYQLYQSCTYYNDDVMQYDVKHVIKSAED